MSPDRKKQFRNALGNYATGIAIVTALDEDLNDMGMTINSFTSVSLNPPLVLWCVDFISPLYAAFNAASHYAIHVLGRDQEDLSQRFADDLADKFSGLELERGIGNLPLLSAYTARFQCKVSQRYEAGDHSILIAEVLEFETAAQDPLVFHCGQYKALAR